MFLTEHNVIVRLLWTIILGTTPVTATGSAIPPPSFLPDEFSLRGDAGIASTATISMQSLTQGMSEEDNVYSRREIKGIEQEASIPTALKAPKAIGKRLKTPKDRSLATSSLVQFFVGESTGRNIYIFYDLLLYSDISKSVRKCFEGFAEVTLMQCDKVVEKLEGIIKSFNQLESLRNIIVLCSSDQTLQIFQKIYDKYLESADIHWFVVLKNDGEVNNVLLRMREGTQVSFAIKEDENNYHLSTSHVDVNNNIALRPVGRWSWNANSSSGSQTSLGMPLVRPLREIYSDFGGRQLTATVIKNWPFWVLEFEEDGTVLPVSGLDFHVLTDISQKLNFTFQMRMTPDKVWGGVMPNGSVTGMVGQVHYHHVHLAINELTLTAKREEAVDYTYPYFHESTTLISPAPPKKLKAYAVFTSFSYEVWILLLLTFVASGPILWGMVSFRANYLREKNTQWKSVSDVTFVLFRSLVMQVAVLPPHRASYRVFFAAWYFFCFLIISLYSDVMISVLAVPSYEKPIDSLWDLLDAIRHRGYMTVISCGSNNEFIFSNTDQKIYKDIWTRFDRKIGCILTWDEGMDKVRTGKFALVNNRMGAEVRANLRGRESFHFARNEFYAHGYSIACPNGSPYRDVFQDVLSPLMWSGLVQKYTNDELMKARRPNLQGGRGTEPISIKHLQANFYLLVAGNVLAVMAYMAEWIVAYHRGTDVVDASY